MMQPGLSRRSVLPAAAVAAAFPAPSRAQQRMPDLVKLVVGLPPGTLPDIIARTLAPYLAGRIAPAVVVENRVGRARGWRWMRSCRVRGTAARCS